MARFSVWLCILLVAVTLPISACGQPSVKTWAATTAATYAGSSSAFDEMMAADPEGIATLMSSFGEAADAAKLAAGKDDAINMFTFFPRYRPVWKAGKLDKTAWDQRRARIAGLTQSDVDGWSPVLQRFNGREMPPVAVVGLLIDRPSLFPEGKLSAARSTLLQKRLANLDPEAIKPAADALFSTNVGAALLIADADIFFSGERPNNEAIARGVTELKAAVAARAPSKAGP